MGSINHNHICSGAYQHLYTVLSVGLYAYGRSYQETALAVLGGRGVVLDFHKVLVGDKPGKGSVNIDHRQLFYLAAH